MRRACKVAEYAAMYYRGGRLIWDDYLHHRQRELPMAAERLCRSFATFTDPDEPAAGLPEPEATTRRALIAELLAAGVLIEQGSAEHRAEQELGAAWVGWGHAAGQYHFASRTLADAHYPSPAEQDAELEARLRQRPAPEPFTRLGGGPAVALPAAALDAGGGRPDWASRPLLDVLLERRTTRDFTADPLPLPELAQFLRAVGGPSPVRPEPDRSATVYKFHPSTGGRHPVELYLHVNRVRGVDAGWYHYDAAGHELEPLGLRWTPGQVAASAGDQDWVGAAAVIVYYTAVLERLRWKYDTARTYRMLQMDVGHLSQTAYLVATAMGLGVGFSAALRDEPIERAIGVDPNHQPVLALTALGHAA